MKLQNKVAFVTGAGQGMGQAIVRRFVAEGAKVVAADINLASLKDGLADLGDSVLPVECNVGDSASVSAAMAATEQHFGRLDIVVNNAGVGGLDSFLETPDESWQRVIGVNLTGTFFCAREGAKLMIKGGQGGSIINLSSTSALTGEGPNHYCASKAGVMGLTRGIARELASQGIRVNTLVPGPTNTPMMAGIPDEMMKDLLKGVPLGRLCEVDEIAAVAVFLACEDSSFMTGQNVAVNGGMSFI
ncbi:SDR family NAD(P)-dependent oxidoreductase [Pseudomonas sp. TTU2014-080ASC]|uniref:SDR family NAD(P)-dependent oxidoreductase n=1 Tax=Pseudomonas sp. TTU2014-080ASC TaxID=1729724 RepID=UPI0007187FC7|nr:SDR family oxidoreductase [Pseudomonas sp. TTU2014-080ASC]KRW58449.1 3-oxoacyl-ACP reductase [Pseudomonas sp. TTU2014-080ASC]